MSVSSTGSAHGEQPTRKDATFPFFSMFSAPSSKNSPAISPVATNRNSAHLLHSEVDQTQSPPSAVGSSESDVNRSEAAAHARRERKIMDLEISNSSLMAINKSLEKEVRRQNRELRRFRRLSRAGRLSTASTMLSVGTADDDFTGELSALDELTEDEEEESPSEESSDDSSSTDLDSLSPEAIAERDWSWT